MGKPIPNAKPRTKAMPVAKATGKGKTAPAGRKSPSVLQTLEQGAGGLAGNIGRAFRKGVSDVEGAMRRPPRKKAVPKKAGYTGPMHGPKSVGGAIKFMGPGK
jgi:hypothetical protein